MQVEANDAVAVAGMQRPKQLPNEILSDLAVSAATKLQRLRVLYFIKKYDNSFILFSICTFKFAAWALQTQ